MIELNDLFDYGYKIYQNTDYFKFSIDSILLAEFPNIKTGYEILDMCSGNVPVPLILASYNKNIHIDAVEIQREVTDLAKKSIEVNGLSSTITVYECDIKDFEPKKEYDIVTCNPPYFKNSCTSEKNLNPIKKIARHECTATLEDIIKQTKRLLKSNGTFYLVHRTERFLETCSLLENYKFGIRRVNFIYTKKDKPAEFFLLEASKCKKSDLKVKSFYVENIKTYKNIFKEGI